VLPLRDNVPTRHFPVMTTAIIAANVLAFLLYQHAGIGADFEHSVDEAAFHPCEVESSCRTIGLGWAPSALTSMFLHADWLHLAGNMLFLWIFGNNVEDAMGPFRFLGFYLLAGLTATGVQTAITLGTAGEEAGTIPNLGASGAISGVLGAYFVLLPRASVLTAIFLIVVFFLREIPAWIFLGIYFVLQAVQANFQLQHPPEGGGVAVFAHVGGIIFGLGAVWLFRKREPLRPAY
jgi:rhomboid family protein